MDPEKIARLDRCFISLCRMMKARGYDLSQSRTFKDIHNLVPQDLSWVVDDLTTRKTIRDRLGPALLQRLNYSVLFKHPNGEKTFAVFLQSKPDKKVDKEDFQVVKNIITNYPDIRGMILISENGITTGGNEYIGTIKGYTFDVLLDTFFAFDRSQHGLFPLETTIIGSDNVRDWSRKEKLNPNELPTIKADDPQAIWFGSRSGNVITSITLGQRFEKAYIARLTT